jgi:glycosyltransferase involved in cell wall biosynthesis
VNLLVITQYFWPENFRINELVLELKKRGWNITVLTGYPNYPSGKIFKEFSECPSNYDFYDGIKVLRVPILPRGSNSIRLILNYLSYPISACIFGFWKMRSEKFDSIFVYEPSPITVGLPAIFFKKIKRAPIIFWVLDLWPETLEAVGVVKSPILIRNIGRVVSYIYRHCDVILAQSKSFIPKIQKYCSGHQIIEYFPGWSEEFSSISKDPACELAQNLREFNILFTGNIGVAQDFPAILNAAEILKNYVDIRWFIVGDGRMFGWVKEEIQRRKLHSIVFMLGRFPMERMPEFFKVADALLVTLKANKTLDLTIPAKLQTYLLSGVPIISMLGKEGSDIVVESACGIASGSGDYVALSKAILKLRSFSPEQRRVMGISGTNYAKLHFNREVLITKLDQIMRRF